MKNSLLKKLVPHAAAALIFLVVSLIYCKPVLEGKVLSQHDITHWKGAIQQSKEYAEKHNGVYPLWTNSMFSGMPTFQIGYSNNNKIPGYLHTVFTLGLPKPVQFFFLASICFYFLCIVMGVRSLFAIMGSLAFAFATYNPVIISVGHDTKMLSIAYMPALVGSLYLIYEKKYWMGTGLTTVFTSVLVTMNHPQIAYYLFIALAVMTVFYIVQWIKEKDWGHVIKALACTVIAGFSGLMTNAVSILSTYEYQKETIRGGASVLADSTGADAKSGLSKDYAMSYSMKITEPLVMMTPRIYGGSSDHSEVDQEESKAIQEIYSFPQKLSGFNQQQIQSFQQQMPLSYYWGGMTKAGEVGTSGPPYIGALVCFLAILGFFLASPKHKWWILTATGLTIIMSWGSYFEAFNGLLYKYLPMYNKFRAPSMILVIPQMLIPLLAVLGVSKLAGETDKKALMASFKKAIYATLGVFVLLLILYMMFDYMSDNDNEFLNQARNAGDPRISQAVTDYFNGLQEDRKSLFLGDILRTFGFVAAGLILVFLSIRKTIGTAALGVGLSLFVLIDLITVDVKYLNYDNYQDEAENENWFVKTKVDEEILQDTSFFRVFNAAGNATSENITSYHYNSVGGYHPAKIRIYQDLIEQQLMKRQPNFAVFNMLNAKYFIQKDPRTGQTQNYQPNPEALGNCWFVKAISFVPDARSEMQALDNFYPADTAIIHEQFKPLITLPLTEDSAAVIRLVKNDNDVITYTSTAATNQFAVFSEVYYSRGWKAFIDDKEAPIVKVNYVLRGLSVPAGIHNIRFEFKPQGYYTGRRLTSIFNIVLIILMAGGIFSVWYFGRKKNMRQGTAS